MKLPKLYINTNLKSDDGKIYNAHYKDRNILLTPIKQRTWGNTTYVWRFTWQSHYDDSECFDSVKLALQNAVEVINNQSN